MKVNLNLIRVGLRYGVGALVSLVWLLTAILKLGINRWQLLWPEPVISVVLILIGLQIGWLILEVDKLLGSFFKGNTQATEFLLQWKVGMQNVVTMAVLAVLGFWLISSSNSVLAWGVVIGVQARLLIEFLATNQYKKWYELIGRSFDDRENMGVKVGFGLLFLIQLLFLIRG